LGEKEGVSRFFGVVMMSGVIMGVGMREMGGRV